MGSQDNLPPIKGYNVGQFDAKSFERERLSPGKAKLRNIFGTLVEGPAVLASALGVILAPAGAIACGVIAFRSSPESWGLLAKSATAVGSGAISLAAMFLAATVMQPLTNTYFHYTDINDPNKTLRQSFSKTREKGLFTPRDPYEGTMTPVGLGIILGLAASLYLSTLPAKLAGPEDAALIRNQALEKSIPPRLMDPRSLTLSQ